MNSRTHPAAAVVEWMFVADLWTPTTATITSAGAARPSTPGSDAGVTTDVDFHPRPYLAPDLGADEYWPPGTLRFIYLPLVMRYSKDQ